MKKNIIIIAEFREAVIQTFCELTLLGRILLGPIILVIFLITAFSIFVGYPLALLQNKCKQQLAGCSKKIYCLFFKD